MKQGRKRVRAQWDPGAERLAVLPRGQAFALVYDAASRAVTRVPTGRSVRPTIAPFLSVLHAAQSACWGHCVLACKQVCGSNWPVVGSAAHFFGGCYLHA